MKKVKEILKELFIDGLSGMATGLFATLIIGTIVSTAGGYVPGFVGTYMVLMGKMAMMLTGAGIGVGVACKLKASPLVTLSAGVAGLIGAFASQLIAGTVLVDGLMHFRAPGEPLGAFIAAMVAIYIGRLVSGKTKVDIILTPLVCILLGGTVGLILGPPISHFMTFVGDLIKFGTEQAPFLMGIIVSVLMGIALTLPISSAAIGVILGLSGYASGAATVGCSANMIGFAVASYKENKVSGLLSQGIGTSMLQVPNIMKKPVIWLPAIIASAILGPLSTMVFKMTNNASGAGMGTSGLVGQFMTWQTMSGVENHVTLLIKIVLLHFILPGLIAYLVSYVLRKKGIIKDGDMKLEQ